MPVQVQTGDPNARAKTAADVKYGSAEAQLRRALEAAATGRAADEAGINKYGEAGRSAIQDTYDQLAGNLETNRQTVNRDLGIQVDQVGAGYRQANDLAEMARARANEGLAKVVANNGAYSPEQLGAVQYGVDNLAAQIIGQNANSDATYTGNLRNWAAQQDALMQSGIAGAGRERASRLSAFENELMNAIAQSKNKWTEAEMGYQGNLLDLLGERGAFEASSIYDYIDQGFNQTMQAAGYNLNEDQVRLDAQYKQAQLAQAAEEMQLKAAMARAEASRADRAMAAQEAAASKDDYWKQLEYGLKRDALNSENARYDKQWLAEQQAAADARNWQIAEFLGNGGSGDLLYDMGYNVPIGSTSIPKSAEGIAKGVIKGGWDGQSSGGGGFDWKYVDPTAPDWYTPVDWMQAGFNPAAAIRIMRNM